MTIKTVVSSFASFLGKYSNEAASIGAALNALVTALPLRASDKKEVLDTISRLENTSANVAASIEEILKLQPTPVKIEREDLVAIVKELLPEIVAAELDKVKKDA